MSLEQAQLEKRSKELDAKEAFIDAKQKILNDAPINLKVYQATEKAHETRLKELVDLIKRENEQLESIRDEKAKETSSADAHKARLSLEVHQLKDELRAVTEELKQSKDTLKEIKDEIKDADKYKEQQTELIDKSIEAGNEKLLELKADATDLENEIEQLKKAKTGLQAEVDDLIIAKDQLELDYGHQTKIINDKIAYHKTELDVAIKSVTLKNKELTSVVNQVDKKLMILKEKETSLIAKQDSVRLEKQELDTEKRRFYSTKSLYNGLRQLT